MSTASKKAIREAKREGRRIARENEEMIRTALKPKPNWVPWAVWIWGMSIFVRVDFPKRAPWYRRLWRAVRVRWWMTRMYFSRAEAKTSKDT